MQIKQTEVHQLLQNLQSSEDFIDRLEQIHQILSWVLRKSLVLSTNIDDQRLPAVRLKFLWQQIDKNPKLLDIFSNTIIEFLLRADLTEALCDVGLGQELSFFQEFGERLINKLLPNSSNPSNLMSFLGQTFTSEQQVERLASIENDIIDPYIKLILNRIQILSTEDKQKIYSQLQMSFSFLISQIRSFGLSGQFRLRSKNSDISENAFFKLIYLDPHLQGKHNLTPEEIAANFNECLQEIQSVTRFLDERGVSISLIFLLERTQREVKRLKILHALSQDINEDLKIQLIKSLLFDLIQTSQSNQSITQIFKDSYQLLTKKVVDRNSEIGDHYTISDKKNFKSMLISASGGGAITAFTVFGKYALYMLPLAPFVVGFSHSINYAFWFLAIYFLGFTLATKQPASTAATIANKIHESDRDESDEIIESIFSILRAQIIAIFGNVILVIPLVALLNLGYQAFWKNDFLSLEENIHILHSIDILGACTLYAAFTGVLLFLSSLIAGWMDNWFIYRRIEDRILYNHKIRSAFGEFRTEQAAVFLKKHIAGISANVSLGFLLGLTPSVFKFLGIPLDIRHVTLSTGALTLAATSGSIELNSQLWIRSILGLIVIGILNVSVSFYLALRFALSAKKVSKNKQILIYKKFFIHLSKKPSRLFWP